MKHPIPFVMFLYSQTLIKNHQPTKKKNKDKKLLVSKWLQDEQKHPFQKGINFMESIK